MHKHTITLLFLFVFLSNSLLAQVTIGSTEKVPEGSLLNLQEFSDIDGVTATKGLGTPRVVLTSKENLFPMFQPNSTGDGYKDADKEDADDLHTGLLVYNAERVDDICKGLYVWDGNVWTPLFPPLVEEMAPETLGDRTGTVTDRDGNVYPVANFGGGGWWMVENLNTKTRFDPCDGQVDLLNATGNKPVGDARRSTPYFEYTKGYPTTVHQEGVFYNWTAATNRKGGDSALNIKYNEGETLGDQKNVEQIGVQGICPKGWHLPSDKELNDLEKALVLSTDEYAVGTSRGVWNEKYRTDTDNDRGTFNLYQKWCSPTKINGFGGFGKSRTDGTGFNYLFVGSADDTPYGDRAYIWSSSNGTSPDVAWLRVTSAAFGGSGGGIQRRPYAKQIGVSVRCKRNI